MPDSSGNVFLEPAAVKQSNDPFPQLIAIFNDTATRIGLGGRFTVPKNYVGTPKIAIVWTSTAISGDVEWDFDYRAVGGNDGESLDQAGTQESVNLNDTAPSAAWERMECLIPLSANFAVDDEVEFALSRDGTDAGDTMAAAACLFQLLFEYADA